MGILQAHEGSVQGNLGTDKVRDRSYLLADSDNHGSDGSHMDCSADPAHNRHNEYGCGGVAAEIVEKRN